MWITERTGTTVHTVKTCIGHQNSRLGPIALIPTALAREEKGEEEVRKKSFAQASIRFCFSTISRAWRCISASPCPPSVAAKGKSSCSSSG